MKIAITLGDPNGVGSEVTLKALQKIATKDISIILVGYSAALASFHPITAPEEAVLGINFLQISADGFVQQWGEKSAQAGKIAINAVDLVTQWAIERRIDAMVTAPLSKETVHAAGYPSFIGHTEFIAEKCGTHQVLMTMICDELRVALASTHIPLAQVANALNPQKLTEIATLFHNSLQQDFGFQHPKIAVLGLNPHAGDGGILGTEEIDWIHPTLLQLQASGINVQGTFAADGFFALRQYRQFDGVIAMYHDQGLIPFKTIAFERGVNFTAGLPIIRTSPDHGTAFDIAGKGIADESSMAEALLLAVQLGKLKQKL
jgi:4-hydroxythreonine-4-phosphate dehydrogenase